MVSLMLLGFVGDITHAHAASPTPQKEVETRTRSMAILKQSLDILENLLAQIDNSLKQSFQPITYKEKLNSSLEAIRINLTGIHTALGNYSPSFAAQIPVNDRGAVQPSRDIPTALQPNAVPPLQTERVYGAGESPQFVVLSPGGSIDIPIPAGESIEHILNPILNPNPISNPNVASISLSTDWKNVLWPSISLIVILALLFFLRRREKEESIENVSPSVINTKPARSEETPIGMEEAPIIY